MPQDKLEKLKKLLEVLKEDTVSMVDFKKAIETLVGVVKNAENTSLTTSQELKDLIEETVTALNEKVQGVTTGGEKLSSELKLEVSKALRTLEKKVAQADVNVTKTVSDHSTWVHRTVEETKTYFDDALSSKLEADEVTALIDKKVEDIKPFELVGEDVVSAVNGLPTDSDDYKIDAKHIKNLPEFKGARVGGSTARNLFQLQDVSINNPTNAQVLKYNSTTGLWENGTGGGGGGGSVDSVVGGLGIDVDATDPTNPIVALDSGTQASLALADSAVQNLGDLGITADATEINYIDGVTSAIQTQLNGKQATGNYITALTGDVTATGPNSVAATIANNAVNYAKMQDVSATARVLGRVTAGSGDVEEIVIDTDLSSVSASDDTVASAKAIKTYVDAQFKAIFSANYAADVAAAGVSRFLALTSAVLPDSGTENQREFPLPVAGTAKNFFFTTTTAQSGTGSLVLTIRKNGADTAIVITIAAGSAAGQFSDTTNTASFNAGDTLDVKVTNNASTNSAAYNGASLAFY